MEKQAAQQILTAGYLAGYIHKEAEDKAPDFLAKLLKIKPKGTLMQELTRPTPSLMGEIFKPRKNAGKDMLAELLKKGLKKTPAKVADKVTQNIVKK